MSGVVDGGIHIGPRLSIFSALGIPLLCVIVFNRGFRESLPNFFRGEADWNTTVDALLSNGVLATLIGGSIAILIASSFLQVITTVGLVVRGVILLIGLGLMINIASIQRIDTYIDTHFFGAEVTEAQCSDNLQIEDLGDSIRATLKGSSEAPEAFPQNSKCGAS